MIYVTGDIHGDIDILKLNTNNFPQQKSLTKDDFLIICGDFGLVWDGSKEELWWRKWLSNRKFTTLWVDGNHENFEMLNDFPLTECFGGMVREIAPSIYHLERGQIYTVAGKKFYCMGGASSHDKEYRTEHASWWPQELPSEEEMGRAREALESVGWEVDYVVSHCAPQSIQMLLADWYENDSLVQFHEFVRQKLSFNRWFFGHYHVDRVINEKFVALYNKIVPIS